MEYVEVQGTRVPALGLGTWRSSSEECRAVVADALRLGVRHIDTAQLYANEDGVGAALSGAGIDRDEIFLTTKVDNHNHAPADVRRSTERSLRDLRTDYVDLLLVHWPVEWDAMAATLTAMQELQDEGKVRHVGVSNFTPRQVEAVLGTVPIFCDQVEYHPYLAQPTLTRMAVDHDFLLTAYAPIARGRVLDDPVVLEIARAHGKTPAQVALRWLLDQPKVCAIPKTVRHERLVENLDVFDFSLTEGERRAIDGLDRNGRLVDPPMAPAWER